MAAMSSMRLLVVAASAPRDLLALVAGDQQRRPAAGARIAAAGAVGENLHFGHVDFTHFEVGSAAPTRTRWRSAARGRISVSVGTRLRALSK